MWTWARYRGFDVTAGDKQFYFTTGNTGLGLAVRGVTVGRDNERTRVDFFAGQSGTLYTSPFFQGFGATSFGAGVFLERKWSHVRLSTLESIQGSRKTALQAIVADVGRLRVTGAAGWLQGARRWDAQAEYRTQRTSLLFSHETYTLGAAR